MDYKRFSKHGLTVEVDEETAAISEIYNFLGGSTFPEPGLCGLCVLSDESGYYCGENFTVSAFN